jgi:DNA repair exonuclease SbcCD nuclease subunit
MIYLVTADWHLRPDAPRCRIDKDWEDTMRRMIKFIMKVQSNLEAELVVVGDLFDFSQQPPWTVNMFLELVGKGTVFAGNHDFKHRNMNEIEASSIGHVLKNPRYKSCVPEFDEDFYQLNGDVLLCHRLVFKPENAGLAKFKNGISAQDLVDLAIEKHPGYEWIFIGDNHHHFHYESDEGIHVVNPGSPLIYNASMIGEETGFYIVDTEDPKKPVSFCEVPDSSEAVTDQYLRDAEEHKEKMEEFVASIDNPEVETMDFFELCDEVSESETKEFQAVYEDIKTETIQIKTKIGKGA